MVNISIHGCVAIRAKSDHVDQTNWVDVDFFNRAGERTSITLFASDPTICARIAQALNALDFQLNERAFQIEAT